MLRWDNEDNDTTSGASILTPPNSATQNTLICCIKTRQAIRQKPCITWVLAIIGFVASIAIISSVAYSYGKNDSDVESLDHAERPRVLPVEHYTPSLDPLHFDKIEAKDIAKDLERAIPSMRRSSFEIPTKWNNTSPISVLHYMFTYPSYNESTCINEKTTNIFMYTLTLVINEKMAIMFGPVYGHGKKPPKRKVADLACKFLYGLDFGKDKDEDKILKSNETSTVQCLPSAAHQ